VDETGGEFEHDALVQNGHIFLDIDRQERAVELLDDGGFHGWEGCDAVVVHGLSWGLMDVARWVGERLL
jgi:hypothetical protein